MGTQKRSIFITSIICLGMAFTSMAQAAQEAQEVVNIYSYRQPYLINPILEKFTTETDIKTNITYAKDGLLERLQREGKYSPADIVLTTDISRVMDFKDKKLVQEVDSETLIANIPSQYRDPDNEWFALTIRVRNIFTSKDRITIDSITYEDLADPKLKGKICTRSGKHPYNIALVASMIAPHGIPYTKKWLMGIKENLARKPQGNDRAQLQAIQAGLCDYSLGNSYYYGNMLKDPKQKGTAESVTIQFPNQSGGDKNSGRGAHVNISGVLMAKHAPNPENAEKLMVFLSQPEAQKMYAEVNMEYPVNPAVAPSKMVGSWGDFKADKLPLTEVTKYRAEAIKLIDEVKFDL